MRPFLDQGQPWRIAVMRQMRGQFIPRAVQESVVLLDEKGPRARVTFGKGCTPSLHTETADWRIDAVSSMHVMYKGIDLYGDGRQVLSSR